MSRSERRGTPPNVNGDTRTVHILLPGYASRPVGGYKVVYEYANHLASLPRVKVEVHESFAFLHAHKPGDHPLPIFSLALKRLKSFVAKRLRPRWFALDPRVEERSWVALPRFVVRAGDVVVATSAGTVPFAAQTVNRGGGRGIYFIQHFESWSMPEDFVIETWRAGLRNVVIAPWLADIAYDLGVPAELVPNGVDASSFPKGPPLSERAPSVLALLSSVPFKRADLLVQAFIQLHEARPDVMIKTFGTDERPAALPTFVEHHKQPRPEVLRALYASSTVYMTASDAEGWHLPPAEALLSGAALVSTDIGGVRAYADGVALFVPVGDPHALALAALDVLEHPESAQQRTDKGRDKLIAWGPREAATAFAGVCLESVDGSP